MNTKPGWWLVVIGSVMMISSTASASIIGDADCFGLGGSCPDGTLYQTDLGGSFFTDYRTASDIATAPFTDNWTADAAITYTQTGSPGDSLVLRIAGVADNRGPWDVFGDGVLLGQIPTNISPNAFEEILTYTFAVPGALLADNTLNVLLNINVPTPTDGYSIDYSQLGPVARAPEPTTLAIFGLGLAGLGMMRRRKTH